MSEPAERSDPSAEPLAPSPSEPESESVSESVSESPDGLATLPAPGPHVGDGLETDGGDGRQTARRVAEWVVLVAVALTVAFVLRTFVVQSFYIPSESMTPTLQVGDRVLVNKLAYRFGDPKRGDIIVFKAPPGEGTADVHDLIKRVVGLPGETLEGRDGAIFVDGEPVDEQWLPDTTQSRDFGPVEVPDDRYWVLGDNRFDSRDSTFFKSIPRDSIVGEAFVRIWPLGDFGFI